MTSRPGSFERASPSPAQTKTMRSPGSRMRTSRSAPRSCAMRAKSRGGRCSRSGQHVMEATREQGAPVDRDREPCLEQVRGKGGAPRVHVARAQVRPPAPDRQQRDIEVAGKVVEAGEDVGVAREVDARPPLEDEPERRRRRSERRPEAVVQGREHDDLEAADGDPIARPDLDHVAAGPPSRR